jgi:hypothetical protein
MNLSEVTYDQFVERAKTAIGTDFEFKCPICGDPCVEPLPQINLTMRFPCEGCKSIISIGSHDPHAALQRAMGNLRMSHKIREIEIRRPSYCGDKKYDGVRVKKDKNGDPAVFGFILGSYLSG